MSRKFIAQELALKTGKTLGESKVLVDVMIDAIVAGIKINRKVELRGLGTFSVRHRRARMARNPINGEPVQLEERDVGYFKASRQLNKELNIDDPR